MKRKLALFLVLCTLSGCANTTPAETTTSEISETTSITTEITTAPPVTTTAQTTTAVTEKTPPEYNGDMPELTAKNISYTVEKRVRIDDLLGQIDIKPQIDVTKLDGYESSVWFYENLATEEEKAYMTDNNYMRHFASLDYIGTELADWLLQIDYYFITDGQTPPEYMRLFYVKDGAVTEELQNIDFIIYGNADNSIHTDDCIYMPTWNNGIYEFNKHTGELKNIVSFDSWSCVSTIDDKYIFFRAEDCLQIYDRESGKVTKTDIYEGMYDGTAVKYNGEVLYYSEDNKYYCYDIATGETSELSEFGVAAANLDYPWDMIAGNSDIGKYHINTKYRTDKLVSMTVTVRESGTQRNYIFEEMAQNFLNDGCVRASLRGEAYGMLCFTIDTYTGSYLFLLDPERNTVQYLDADEIDTFFLSAIADTLICYTDSGYYTVVPEIKYEKADLFPDEELYPVPSDEVTEAIFFETAEGVKYENEEDFPHQGHLRLAKELCWAKERVQEQIRKAELPEDSLFTLPENMEDLTAEGLYHYDFDSDGKNESFIHIRYLPFMSCGMLIYVDEDGAEIIAEETGESEILVYAFDDFCYTQIAFYYGMTGIDTGIYDLRNGFSEPLVSGTNCEYENGVFYVYNKAEFTDYPVICCADGVFRQTGREEITREDFEKHVKNGAEYLDKLEAQYISINKIETWGHYTYQLTCTERGADFGINITMRNINDIDDEAAYVCAPYEITYEPQLTEEYIYGVDVWALAP